MTRQLGFSVLAVFAILTTPAKAAFLTGSIGFFSDTTTINSTDVNTATTFSFSTVKGGANTVETTSPSTGSFAAVPANTVVNSDTLDLNAAGGTAAPFLKLTLGSDSFTATTLLSSTSVGGNTQVVELQGIIAGPGFSTTPADFALSFTQAGGPNTAISFSGTLSAIPEPASIILMGMGLIGAMGVSRRRLGRLSRRSS